MESPGFSSARSTRVPLTIVPVRGTEIGEDEATLGEGDHRVIAAHLGVVEHERVVAGTPDAKASVRDRGPSAVWGDQCRRHRSSELCGGPARYHGLPLRTGAMGKRRGQVGLLEIVEQVWLEGFGRLESRAHEHVRITASVLVPVTCGGFDGSEQTQLITARVEPFTNAWPVAEQRFVG
jgi:hypothetical protein